MTINQGNNGGQTTDKKEYVVTYDANGGKFSDGGTTVTQKVKEGSTLTAPTSPIRTASAFGGWATEKNGKTLWKFASDTVTKNITLYAVWQEQSAAIISADGATINESSKKYSCSSVKKQTAFRFRIKSYVRLIACGNYITINSVKWKYPRK